MKRGREDDGDENSPSGGSIEHDHGTGIELAGSDGLVSKKTLAPQNQEDLPVDSIASGRSTPVRVVGWSRNGCVKIIMKVAAKIRRLE